MSQGLLTTEEAKKANIDELLKKLAANQKGLSSSEAGKRLQQYGPNEIQEKKVNPLKKFLRYFWGPIPFMIEAAVIMSAVIQRWPDFAIILTLLMVNAIVGSWQEHKAGNAIELLKKRLALKARVLRDAKWQETPAEKLVPGDKVEFIYSDELYKDIDYWAKTVIIAKNLTLAARTTRTLEIAGRKEGEAHYVSDYLYTPMQVADIFHMKVKICQLGMDQRKANMVGREIGEKIGCWKPVCVHHHLLQGLEKPKVWPIPEGQEREAVASAKMSKSKPETCIFIYDTPEEIKQKMAKAFCPERTVKFNPVLDICKYIIFREKPVFTIERPAKFGGNIAFESFQQLESTFAEGKLHPMDLKNGVATELGNILEPVRRYFANNMEAKDCLETVRKAKITR